jgi:hypothetical protein
MASHRPAPPALRRPKEKLQPLPLPVGQRGRILSQCADLGLLLGRLVLQRGRHSSPAASSASTSSSHIRVSRPSLKAGMWPSAILRRSVV